MKYLNFSFQNCSKIKDSMILNFCFPDDELLLLLLLNHEDPDDPEDPEDDDLEEDELRRHSRLTMRAHRNTMVSFISVSLLKTYL